MSAVLDWVLWGNLNFMAEIFEDLRTLGNHDDLAVYSVSDNAGLSHNIIFLFLWHYSTFNSFNVILMYPKTPSPWPLNTVLFSQHFSALCSIIPHEQQYAVTKLKRSWWYFVWDYASYIMTWVERGLLKCLFFFFFFLHLGTVCLFRCHLRYSPPTHTP